MGCVICHADLIEKAIVNGHDNLSIDGFERVASGNWRGVRRVDLERIGRNSSLVPWHERVLPAAVDSPSTQFGIA